MRRPIGRIAGASLMLLFAVSACSQRGQPAPTVSSPSIGPTSGRSDVGGYSLAYLCQGSGSPTVVLEAGYTASGIDTYGPVILPAVARTTRVCTYDRAGDGTSDPRPVSAGQVTGATQARELHALLTAIQVGPPYIVVGHSYGGMVAREVSALYPTEIQGMVLIDSSSEPDIPVYARLHAGAWIDGTVSPAPNQRIDIHATVRELQAAPGLGALPLVVLTAGILEDRWLRTVPALQARAQTRLAGLSTNSIHAVIQGVGHFITRERPSDVVAAVGAVVVAVRSHESLTPCQTILGSDPSVQCLARGELGHQQT